MFAMKKLILAAFAIVAVVVTSGNADAAFAIRIIDTASNTTLATINDGQIPPNAFVDLNGTTTGILATTYIAPFSLNSAFAFGNFNIDAFTGSIGASGATASSAALGVKLTATGAGSITFEFSRTGYTFPGVGLRQVADSFSTTASGTTPLPASVSYQSFLNSDNLLFSTSGASNGPIGLSPIPGGPGSGSFLDTLTTTASPFSITTRTTFTFTNAAGEVGYNSRTDVTAPANIVPAPAGLLLSLLGLPALAFARRFRRDVPVQA